MIGEAVREAVHGVVRHMSSGDVEVSDEARIATDLGFDSLRLLELAVVIEERFQLTAVELDEALAVATVGELVDFVTERVAGTAA